MELGPRGQVLYADPILRTWLPGGLPKQLGPRHFHPEDRAILRRTLRTLSAGAPLDPVAFRLRDGRRFQAQLRLLPGKDGMHRVLATCREADLARAFVEAHARQQRQARLEVMVGGIAHDLGNLLGALLGNLQLARTRLAQGQSPHEHLDRVERSADRAVELCRRLRTPDLSGAQDTERVDFRELVQESLALLEVWLPPEIRLHTDLAQGPFPIQGHRSALQQAVMNLVLNAVESHQGQAGSVWIRTASASHGGRPGLVLEVQDDGCGMTEEVRARILEPGFSTKGAGRGLGLNAMAEMLRHHRGSLDVQSVPGGGSTFRLSLPMHGDGMEKL